MIMDQEITGRLAPEEWAPDAEGEITTPCLVLPAAYFARCVEDDVLRAAGPDMAVFATADAWGDIVAWDNAAARLVDEAELPSIAWVP